MTAKEKLRNEYFIESEIGRTDTNDSIEMGYLKWLEEKIIYTRHCEALLSDTEAGKAMSGVNEIADK